jgi:DNA polymerase III delta prime subunit
MQKLKIKKITKIGIKKKVYDLSVDETHNFFVGNKKVLTSNCDGLSKDGQKALRNTIEEYSEVTRFILTANYKHKIIPALQSRTQSFDFTADIGDVLKRVAHILSAEGITVSGEQKSKLGKLIKNNFPDIRKIINEVQKNCVDGKLDIQTLTNLNNIYSFMHECITGKKSLKLRKYLIENDSEFQGDYHALMRGYLEHVYKCEDLSDEQSKRYILCISEHLYKDAIVMDKEINAFACFVKLEEIY